jgi:hypothetical protein
MSWSLTWHVTGGEVILKPENESGQYTVLAQLNCDPGFVVLLVKTGFPGASLFFKAREGYSLTGGLVGLQRTKRSRQDATNR